MNFSETDGVFNLDKIIDRILNISTKEISCHFNDVSINLLPLSSIAREQLSWPSFKMRSTKMAVSTQENH
jgi:hypothetical protein